MSAAPKKKVLIIDDETGFAIILKIALEEHGGYDVRVENGCLEGFATACKFKPDVVLMDVRLPDGSGPLTAAKLKGEEGLKHASLIFVSATPLEENSKLLKGLSGCPYITKPAGPDEILTCIRQVLDNGKHGNGGNGK